jgi:hypothetical protein
LNRGWQGRAEVGEKGVVMGASTGKEKETKPHRCSVCGQLSEATICPTCEARIRGEILDEKGKAEKGGHTETGRH